MQSEVIEVHLKEFITILYKKVHVEHVEEVDFVNQWTDLIN